MWTPRPPYSLDLETSAAAAAFSDLIFSLGLFSKESAGGAGAETKKAVRGTAVLDQWILERLKQGEHVCITAFLRYCFFRHVARYWMPSTLADFSGIRELDLVLCVVRLLTTRTLPFSLFLSCPPLQTHSCTHWHIQLILQTSLRFCGNDKLTMHARSGCTPIRHIQIRSLASICPIFMHAFVMYATVVHGIGSEGCTFAPESWWFALAFVP